MALSDVFVNFSLFFPCVLVCVCSPRYGLSVFVPVGYNLLNFNNSITDIDECADSSDNCDANAACTNTGGSFTCACNTGYSGNGVTCSGKILIDIQHIF